MADGEAAGTQGAGSPQSFQGDSCSPQACFARDGYCVLRGVVDTTTIAALQRDAEARAAGLDLTQDGTVWVHGPAALPLRAPARTDWEAYLHHRAHGESGCPLIAAALQRTLPAAAMAATGWHDLRLFNEHYVIKPAGGGQHFLWHRDADRHLRCAELVGPRARADPDPEAERIEGSFYAGAPPAAVAEYVNTWAPLDPCSVESGTLCLLPARTPFHRSSGAPAARPCCLDTCEQLHAVHMCLQPGDVCVFASYLFHTSRPNRSPTPRRVHYASWSRGAVRWGDVARTQIIRALARRPTAAAPERRYELLRSLGRGPRAGRRPTTTTSAAPALMFAVPVAVQAAERGATADTKRQRLA